MDPSGRQIAAFDFDGTLTIRDSLNAFLAWRASPLWWTRVALAGAAYLAHHDRGRVKTAAVRAVLGGLHRAELEAAAEAFAESAWPRLMRPDALVAWRRHQAAGDHCVIVTASPEITIAPFARRLGAAGLLGTPLTFDADDRLVGMEAAANCRGQEKVRRLQDAFGPGVRLAAAYGDTSGDREMLAIADRPGYRVFTGRP